MATTGDWLLDRLNREKAMRLLGPCPRCGASAGLPCRSTDPGSRYQRRRPHSERPRLADAAAIVDELRAERALHVAGPAMKDEPCP